MIDSETCILPEIEHDSEEESDRRLTHRRALKSAYRRQEEGDGDDYGDDYDYGEGSGEGYEDDDEDSEMFGDECYSRAYALEAFKCVCFWFFVVFYFCFSP
jgi:hypothetical protein